MIPNERRYLTQNVGFDLYRSSGVEMIAAWVVWLITNQNRYFFESTFLDTGTSE